MTQFNDAWLAHQRKRWMRPDAHRWIRPDAYRFMPPGAPRYDGKEAVKYFWPEAETDDVSPHDDAEAAELQRELDDIRREWEALMRAWRAQKAGFNPGQPRVPAGNSGGGQWTSRDRSAQSNLDADLLESDAEDGSIDDAQLGAQSILDDAAEPSIQLVSDESESDRLLNRHIIEQHIDKTDDELIARIQREQIRGIFVSTGLDRNGAFDSIESARDLIQQTINNNSDVVARVASGRSTDAFLTWRFGRVTGREAILDLQTSTVRMRKTYEVGVAIVHDPNSLSGYRIVTAYPRNYNSRIGR